MSSAFRYRDTAAIAWIAGRAELPLHVVDQLLVASDQSLYLESERRGCWVPARYPEVDFRALAQKHHDTFGFGTCVPLRRAWLRFLEREVGVSIYQAERFADAQAEWAAVEAELEAERNAPPTPEGA